MDLVSLHITVAGMGEHSSRPTGPSSLTAPMSESMSDSRVIEFCGTFPNSVRVKRTD